MNKLKILFINDFGYRLGGVEVNLINQAFELRRRGYTIKILTSDANPSNSSLVSDYTFKSYSDKSLSRLFNQIIYIPSYLKLKNVIEEYQPHIIFLHNIF